MRETNNHLFNVAIALVHWPVRDKIGDVIATNVTNFDIHDIARVACTYGVSQYFIVHPQREQLMFVSRILDHWRVGYGSRFNPSRGAALKNVELFETIDDVINSYADHRPPRLVGTAARDVEGLKRISFRELREQWQTEDKSSADRKDIILFGTGYGLTDDCLKRCDYVLEPIMGNPSSGFRHLSVRSAVSICLDRLLSTW